MIKIKSNNSTENLFNKLSTKFFDNASLLLLSIWVLYPLLMMELNIFSDKFFARDIMYYVLYFVGGLGLILGLTMLIKKVINKEFILKKYLPLIILLILILWCFIPCFCSNNLYRSFSGSYYRKEGLFTYIFYYGILLLGIMLKSDQNRKILLNELLFVQIIIAIVSLMNNDITHMLTYNQEPYDGIFSQFNHYGYYLMFGVLSSMFLFINGKKRFERLLYFLSYILLTYTLIMNDTFGCFLAVLFTLILITIHYRKNIKKILLVLIAFIVLCSCTFRDNKNVVLKNFNALQKDTKEIKKAVKKKKAKNIDSIGTSRGVLWRVAIENSLKKPITGYGIDNFEYVYKKYHVPQDRPHNILIQFLIFTGIFGVLIYIVFIFNVLKRGLYKKKELEGINLLSFFMVICYLSSSMTGNSMFYTSPYYFIFLGILLSNLFYTKKTL